MTNVLAELKKLNFFTFNHSSDLMKTEDIGTAGSTDA